jgi:inorganic pyrophosphatase
VQTEAEVGTIAMEEEAVAVDSNRGAAAPNHNTWVADVLLHRRILDVLASEEEDGDPLDRCEVGIQPVVMVSHGDLANDHALAAVDNEEEVVVVDLYCDPHEKERK